MSGILKSTYRCTHGPTNLKLKSYIVGCLIIEFQYASCRTFHKVQMEISVFCKPFNYVLLRYPPRNHLHTGHALDLALIITSIFSWLLFSIWWSFLCCVILCSLPIYPLNRFYEFQPTLLIYPLKSDLLLLNIKEMYILHNTIANPYMFYTWISLWPILQHRRWRKDMSLLRQWLSIKLHAHHVYDLTESDQTKRTNTKTSKKIVLA